MAAAFVLQYLCQIPAQTLAYAVRLGPWRVDPAALTFDVGPYGTPERVHLGSAVGARPRPESTPESTPEATAEPSPEPTPDTGSDAGSDAGVGAAWAIAERDYRAVAEPLATSYPSIAKLGSGTRLGMVEDLWAMAVRDASGAPTTVERRSCCFLYALPGCHVCAGCPRRRRGRR